MCAIFFLVSCSLSHFSLLLPYPLQYFQVLVWFLLTYQHRRWFIYYIIFSKVWTILGRVWKTFMDTINNNLVKNWPQPVTCKWNMYFCFCMPGAKCISHLHAGLFNRDEQRIRGPHACPASHSWHQGAHTLFKVPYEKWMAILLPRIAFLFYFVANFSITQALCCRLRY
jgi:hypothetical protein